MMADSVLFNGGTGMGQSGFSCSRLKLDSLFLHWFSLPETQNLILHLIDDVKEGRSAGTVHANRRTTPLAFTPPLSPKKDCLSMPSSPSRRAHTSAHTAAKQQQPPVFNREEIPQFYFPHFKHATHQITELQMTALLKAQPDVLGLNDVKTLLKEAFNLPSALAYPLLCKLSPGTESGFSKATLVDWLRQNSFAGKQDAAQAFDILRQEGCTWVSQQDLRPLLAGIVVSHPGLEFLHDSPEFQERYAETVIYRIFYSLNRSGHRLTLRDFKRGDLVDILCELDAQEDINKMNRYFSYEHFYVIYCKFWDLDSDHDFVLSREDLLRYGNHALTFRITERVFSQAGRPFTSGVPGRMGYEDFVWFILSEEDKTTETSLEYWFRCVDLNGDGKLTPDELIWFYEEQLHRMECLSQETVTFADILSQMQDMLSPKHDDGCFTLLDLKQGRPISGALFNVLFNLNKFVAFETRDPFAMRQEREEVGVTEWDRFARSEYVRLAVEDDNDAESNEGLPWAAGID